MMIGSSSMISYFSSSSLPVSGFPEAWPTARLLMETGPRRLYYVEWHPASRLNFIKRSYFVRIFFSFIEARALFRRQRRCSTTHPILMPAIPPSARSTETSITIPGPQYKGIKRSTPSSTEIRSSRILIQVSNRDLKLYWQTF